MAVTVKYNINLADIWIPRSPNYMQLGTRLVYRDAFNEMITKVKTKKQLM